VKSQKPKKNAKKSDFLTRNIQVIEYQLFSCLKI